MRHPLARALLLAAALLPLLGGPAAAYPYLATRPIESVLSGPTDASLGALLYNPAALRLLEGNHAHFFGGGHGYLGSYRRAAPLPPGFAPGQTAAEPAPAADIRWFNPSGLAAVSSDLGSDSVTLALGLSIPYVDQTRYAEGDDPDALGRLTTRYHAVRQATYSMWGSVGVALRVTSWFYLGGNFNFGWTHARWRALRDPDPAARDGFTCAGTGPCESFSRRLDLQVNVSDFGYGFSTGVLILPPGLEDRLFIGASYLSPLFSGLGTQVPLSSDPQISSFCTPESQDEADPGRRGVRVSGLPADDPTVGRRVCHGAAQLLLSFPHVVYLGARVRAPLLPARRGPRHLEINTWLRLSIPDRNRTDPELLVERRALSAFDVPGRQVLPLSRQPAVAVQADIRQLWPRLELAQGLLYESARSAEAAVSPANVESHKIDVSVTGRVRLHPVLWLSATAGLTSFLFGDQAGAGFRAEQAAACRPTYDITSQACQDVQDGWARPTAAGRYDLFVLHGGVGLEIRR